MASTNSAIRTSSARRPRGIVKINGQGVTAKGFEVHQKNYFAAATFRVDFEALQQPEGYGLSFWAGAGTTQLECLMGFLGAGDSVSAAPSNPTSLVIGNVDDVDIDPITGNLVATGRDFTALFINNKVTSQWPDAVASDVATKLAQENGLTPQVTTTTTQIGTKYNNQFAAMRHDLPEWDLLTWLAQQEGFDCYVKGTTLYFGPPQADNDPSPYIVALSPGSKGLPT